MLKLGARVEKTKLSCFRVLRVVGWVGRGASAGTLSTTERGRGVGGLVADTSQCPGEGEGDVGRGGGGGCGTLGWFVTTAELDHSDPN